MSNKVLIYPGQQTPIIPIVPNIPGQIVQIYTSSKITDLFESNNLGARGKTSASFTVFPANIKYDNIDLSDFCLVNSGEVFAAATSDYGDKRSGNQVGKDTHTITIKELPSHEHYYYADTRSQGDDFQYTNEAGVKLNWTVRSNYHGDLCKKHGDNGDGWSRKFTTGKEGANNPMDVRQSTRYVITMVYTPTIFRIGYDN